jgi:fluoroacetyl-CoA thioesterase
MELGQKAMVSDVVTPEMFARFEGNIVHPIYSTVTMVYHMEWAARQIILPYLEDHEEGVGASVTVRHLAPSPEGTRVEITATLTKYTENKVITKVEARNEKGLIGEGEVIQIILPKEKIIENSEK